MTSTNQRCGVNCENIKEILITDYVDGELSREQMKAIDEHLSACPNCRQFKEELIQNIVNPFKAIDNATPPEYVWQNIRTAIAENSSVKNNVLLDFFKRHMSLPVISAATAAVILVLGSFLYFNQPSKNIAMAKSYSADESYFAYLYEGMENNETESALAEDDLLS